MSNSKNQAITFYNDANELYKNELYKEALDLYIKSTENDLTFYDAHFCIAKTYIRLSRDIEGINHYKKYINLIPNNKKSSYTFALSNILLDEKRTEKALQLVETIDANIATEQEINYALLLLLNNKDKKVLKFLINSKDYKRALNNYAKLLEDDRLDKSIIEKLKSENIIPAFFRERDKLTLLKNTLNNNEDYKTKLSEASQIILEIKDKDVINYSSEITVLKNKITDIQNTIFEQAKRDLKTENTSALYTIYNILIKSGYKNKELEAFKTEIDKIKIKKKSKTIKKFLKISLIIFSSILVLFFINNYYQKNKAYNSTIKSNSVYKYTAYLNKYGDNDKIHSLREKKLYQNALNSNTTKEINKIINLYPNSNYLREISIDIPNATNANINLFGANSNEYENIQGKTNNNSFKVPAGCKIGLVAKESEKLAILKYFTVSKNIEIQENFIQAKTMLLNENFENNNNNWHLVKEKFSNNSYSNIKKEIVINDRNNSYKHNKLYIFNNENGKLLFSLINLPELKNADNFEITTEIEANKYFSNGFYLLFGATDSAFLYFGYAGFTNSSKYAIGNNNWNSSNDTWKNWNGKWTKNNYSQLIATLKVIKQNNKLFYYINGAQVGAYIPKRFYGNKIGFGSNNDTKTIVKYLTVKKLNREPKTDFIKDNIYYCWVGELNVRDTSHNGKIITKIKVGDPVKYLGKVGIKKVNASFREKFKPDYYYKFELKDGTIGWLHGGGLNDLQTTNKIELTDFKIE